MTLEFKLVDTDDYLLCEVNGSYGPTQDSIDYFLEVLLRCRSSAAPRVLIDLREVVGNPSAVEKILFYEKIIDKYEIYLNFGGLPIRMVFLVNPRSVNEYNPGLDVAKRRNFPATVESDLQKAIDWLATGAPVARVNNISAILEY